MEIDDTRLRDLLEQSQDLHSDAMTTSRGALDELVETTHDITVEKSVDKAFAEAKDVPGLAQLALPPPPAGR